MFKGILVVDLLTGTTQITQKNQELGEEHA